MTTAALPTHLPLNLLKLEHEFFSNPRTTTGLDATEIAEMADSIHAHGVKVAVMVVQAKNKETGEIENVVFDGQRRVLGAREALKGSALIPVSFLTDKPGELNWEKSDQILLDVIEISNQRAGLSSYELSEIAERMKNRGKTLAEIGAKIGKSESWVSRMLTARNKAHPDTLKAWRSGKLTDEQFKDIAATSTEGQPEVMKDAKDAAKNASGSREAKAETRNLIKERAEAARAKAKPAPKDDEEKPYGYEDTTGDAPELVNDATTDNSAAVTQALSNGIPAGKKPVSSKPPKLYTATAKAELESLLALVAAGKRVPINDYVKGILHGVEYALGKITPEQFGRPWGVFMTRLSGVAKVPKEKPTKKLEKARQAKVKAEKAPRKAKAKPKKAKSN